MDNYAKKEQEQKMEQERQKLQTEFESLKVDYKKCLEDLFKNHSAEEIVTELAKFCFDTVKKFNNDEKVTWYEEVSLHVFKKEIVSKKMQSKYADLFGATYFASASPFATAYLLALTFNDQSLKNVCDSIITVKKKLVHGDKYHEERVLALLGDDSFSWHAEWDNDLYQQLFICPFKYVLDHYKEKNIIARLFSKYKRRYYYRIEASPMVKEYMSVLEKCAKERGYELTPLYCDAYFENFARGRKFGNHNDEYFRPYSHNDIFKFSEVMAELSEGYYGNIDEYNSEYSPRIAFCFKDRG